MTISRVQIDASLDPRRLPDFDVLMDGTQTAAIQGREDWSISMGTFWTGLSAGVEVVELCNGPMSVYVLPTRGMGIWNARYQDHELGWNSPVHSPVHPKFVNLTSRNGLGWLDGFSELLCRCGLAFNGPPGKDAGARSPIESEITLHGRIANTPAYDIELTADDESGWIGVHGTVDETTLFGPQLQMRSSITTKVGSTTFRVKDEITNRGSIPHELSLLYHTNVGAPFLEDGGKLHVAAARVTPRDQQAAVGVNSFSDCTGPEQGYAEQVFYFDLLTDTEGQCEVVLVNANGDLGLRLKFSKQQMPYFAFWKCFQHEKEGYVSGLEPAINLPNFKSFEREQGRIHLLQPGETYTTELEFEILDSAESVQQVVAEIQKLQATAKPHLDQQPTLPWSNI